MKLPVTDEHLLRYLNGELAAPEIAALKVQLAETAQLNQRLEELRVIQTYLKQTSRLETPNVNFTAKVMAGLEHASIERIPTRRGLILLIGSIVASGILLGLISLGAFDSSTTLLIEPPVKNTFINLQEISIPFNTKVLINGIIFLNLGLLFMLLDRTILKPLFQNRAAAG
jgi:anti-sigma factor RsiW